MEKVYITGIIAATIVIVVFALRDRITDAKVRGKINQGDLDIRGEAGVRAASIEKDSQVKQQPSIEISGKTILGRDKIKVTRPDVRVNRDTFAAKSDIEISNEQNISEDLNPLEPKESKTRLEEEKIDPLPQIETK